MPSSESVKEPIVESITWSRNKTIGVFFLVVICLTGGVLILLFAVLKPLAEKNEKELLEKEKQKTTKTIIKI